MKLLLPRILLSFLLIAATTIAFASTGGGSAASWQTDYKKALTQAKTSKKQILLNFTGSDWCGWCIKLKKEIFDQPQFIQFARENLILVDIDFPHKKSQTESLKKQNTALQTEYAVEGFPTLVLLDSEGKQLRKHVGYLEGGPQALIRWIRNGN